MLVAANRDFLAWVAHMFVLSTGGRVPLFISSTVSFPEYPCTASVMTSIIKQKDELKRVFGIDVVQPDGMATNPNMRDHMIDSLVLVAGADTDHLQQGHFSDYYKVIKFQLPMHTTYSDVEAEFV